MVKLELKKFLQNSSNPLLTSTQRFKKDHQFTDYLLILSSIRVFIFQTFGFQNFYLKTIEHHIFNLQYYFPNF